MIPRIKHDRGCAIFLPPCTADCNCGAFATVSNTWAPASMERCAEGDRQAAVVSLMAFAVSWNFFKTRIT